MRKFVKRFYYLPAVLLLISLFVLSACSSSPPATTTPPTTTTTMPPMTMTPITTPPPSTTTTTTPTGPSVTVDLSAKSFAFDKASITVPAGAAVTLNFTNNDSGVPHNFSLYTDSSAAKAIFVGKIIQGVSTITYQFTAPSTPGTYFFRCDVHPTQMTGSFIVQ